MKKLLLIAVILVVACGRAADKLPVDELTAVKIESLQKDQQLRTFQFAQIQQQAVQLQNAFQAANAEIEKLKAEAYAKAHVKIADYVLDVTARTLTRIQKPPVPTKATPPGRK